MVRQLLNLMMDTLEEPVIQFCKASNTAGVHFITVNDMWLSLLPVLWCVYPY